MSSGVRHSPRLRTVASGAGRVVCSCGWESDVIDDGAMYDENVDSAEEQWRKHWIDEVFIGRFVDPKEAAKEEREDILTEALRLTNGDRQNQYGPPDQDFARTAAMWNTLFRHKLRKEFAPSDVAMAMICLKLSRQSHQQKRDNWVDIAGYAKCGAVCDEKKA